MVLRRNKRGQSSVELVLLTPFILIALYVPIDFGIAYLAAHLTQNAVREVARIGAAQDAGTFNSTALRNNLNTRIPENVAIVSSAVNKYTTNPANCMAVVKATATIRYNFFFYRMMRWFGFNIPSSKDIIRTTVMRYEFQPHDTTTTLCTAA